MPKFVYDPETDRMVNKETREPMVSGDWTPVAPRIVGDGIEYESPITGELITGRRQEREHMAKHGVVHSAEVRERPFKLKNERFIEKRGLQSLAE